MTTTTYTAPIATSAPVATGNKALSAFNKVNTFFNVFFGATADADSNFRGLDMNGNAMWVTKR